jgi:septal ring factor EnvC (AmiA/AmiB activator)
MILAATWCGTAVSQSGSKESARLRENKEKLTKLLAEKAEFEKKLNESKRQEKTTQERLSNLERQANHIRRLIKKLREQEQDLAGDIQEAHASIKDLEQQLESLKTQYAKYVRSVYKYGRVYDVELLFSSRSINQLYIRMEYLKRFSDQRAKDLREVVHKKTNLEEENEQLQSILEHERRLLSQKTSEEFSLKQKMSERQKMLNSIRKDKHKYEMALNERKESEKKLRKIIDDLIESDIRREREAAAARERNRKTAPSAAPVPEATGTGAFASQKGKLRWPVSAGTIVSRFGKQVHPVLKTERENTGIGIGVDPGSKVMAVADGNVSIVTYMPGFGNIVILTHSGGYRTIYADLSEIGVAESQKVKVGEVIGKSGVSVDGKVLHFELWKDREKQNPEVWLAK